MRWTMSHARPTSPTATLQSNPSSAASATSTSQRATRSRKPSSQSGSPRRKLSSRRCTAAASFARSVEDLLQLSSRRRQSASDTLTVTGAIPSSFLSPPSPTRPVPRHQHLPAQAHQHRPASAPSNARRQPQHAPSDTFQRHLPYDDIAYSDPLNRHHQEAFPFKSHQHLPVAQHPAARKTSQAFSSQRESPSM